MAHSNPTNVSLEEAKIKYLERMIENGMAPKAEKIPVAEAAGRITAQPVFARICAPHYNASAMDGIAIDTKLTLKASRKSPVSLAAGLYARVNTGNVLPEGCDAVIMAEDTAEAGDGTVKIFKAAAPWQNIRRYGEDLCTGDMILPSFSHVTPAAVGAVFAGGVTEIIVSARPIVGIIPVGDDWVSPASDPDVGKIPEFNSAVFSAMIREWGAGTVTYPIVRNDPAKILDSLRTAILECDIVLLSVGSSAGSEDHVFAAMNDVGEVMYRGLPIKPGRPTMLGYCGAKPILGVPGFPVSGIIVIEQILRPFVDYLTRRPPVGEEYEEATLSKSIVSQPEYQEFARVRLGYVSDRLIAMPLSRGSGVVASFMKADGIVEIPRGVVALEGGDSVNVRLLKHTDEIRRSIVAVGSHDPLLDELSELLRVMHGDVFMASSHVGSMAGLLAVRKGEAHMAGTHLLDVATGGYNESFVRKFFAEGGVRLVECVRRMQGFIVPKGNPLGIAGVSDLARDKLRYINRQNGSGTRILIDYLCGENGVDKSSIHGYENYDYTHTAVAARIASGSADVGLGVFSAAKLFDLDFVPVCREQYDLLIPDHAWDLPMVQKLLDVLKSDRFRQRICALGGYDLESPGEVRLKI